MSSSRSSRLRALGNRLFRKETSEEQETILKPPPSFMPHQWENQLLVYRTLVRDEVRSISACKDLENYEYDSLPTAIPHIRLLRVLEVGFEVVTCSLEIYPLSEVAGKFEALSYTWGTEAFTSNISIDGKKLSITPSLEETLRELYTYQHHSYIIARGLIMDRILLFWIDAICLNQSDRAEVVQHLPLMGQIYSVARSTFVYLGKRNENSDSVMDTMASMNTILEKLKKRNDKKGDVLLPDTGWSLLHPIWEWYGAVYRRPWCERLWILQEVVLARHVLFGCGDRWVSGVDFFGVLRKLNEMSLTDALMMPSSVISETDIISLPFDQVILMTDTSIQYGRTEGMRQFLNLLSVTRNRLCTEPTDRLWAILGLLGDKLQDELRASILIGLTPGGKKAYWNIYMQLAMLIVRRDPNALGKLLQSAASESRPSELPTWCPNWSVPTTYHPFVFANCKASGDFLPPNLQNQSPAIAFESNELHLTGFRIDTIASIMRVSKPALGLDPRKLEYDTIAGRKTLAWEEECFQMAKAVYSSEPDDNDIRMQHILNLIGGPLLLPKGSPYLNTHCGECYNSWKYLIAFQAADPHMITSKDVKQFRKCLGMGSIFADQMDKVFRGRRYVTTTGGRIGAVVGSVEVGDSVVLIYGAGPLYLLRFGEDGKAKLLGDAYVYGLMDEGEAFASPDRGVDERFVLI